MCTVCHYTFEWATLKYLLDSFFYTTYTQIHVFHHDRRQIDVQFHIASFDWLPKDKRTIKCAVRNYVSSRGLWEKRLWLFLDLYLYLHLKCWIRKMNGYYCLCFPFFTWCTLWYCNTTATYRYITVISWAWQVWSYRIQFSWYFVDIEGTVLWKQFSQLPVSNLL